VHSHLLEAVESGRLDESLIDQAVARIDKLFSTRPVLLSETELEEFTNELPIKRERALKTSCAAVTILRGEIPTIDSGSWLLIVPKHPRYPMNLEKYLSSIAAHRFTSLTFSELRYPLAPTPEETESIIRQCTERNCIFLTYRSLINQSQLQLGSMIAEEAREKIVVSTDTPFDLLGLPDWENVAATYDPSELAMEALAKVLLGEFSASGICPVSLEFQIVKLTP
jgi:beta-N-acetylhexosaminidase